MLAARSADRAWARQGRPPSKISVYLYVHNAHFAAHGVGFFAEGLAAVFAIDLIGQPFHHMHDRAFVVHVDKAAANADLARGAAHNNRCVAGFFKGFAKALLLARAQQIVDVGRGHGSHARFAAATRVKGDFGPAEVS